MKKFTSEQVEWAQAMEAGSRCRLSKAILWAYRFRRLQKYCLSSCIRLEGGRFFSSTLRSILAVYHGVIVGQYSYGPCLIPRALPPGTRVGSYCSLAGGLSVHRRNHPSETLTQHPFFYNSSVGLLPTDAIDSVEANPLRIHNDVWVGDRSVILPGCKEIGNGAVVGAGSVVTRDIEPFTVVAGNPARPIRKRYPDEIIQELQRSRWWDLSLAELLSADDLLLTPMGLDRLREFVDTLEVHKQRMAPS